MRAALAVVALLAAMPLAAQQQQQEAPKLRALIVTGGHDFEREAFFAVFDSFEGLEYREVVQPEANDSYAPEVADTYDVLVLYDMVQEITEEQKAQLVALLEQGKGLLVLHHAIASYQDWPEYEQIIGGRYYLSPHTEDGQELPASTAREGVDLEVHIADPEHPVTAGMEDYTTHDEAYGGFAVAPTVHPLLTTDHPDSGEVIAWAHTYGNSRVVYIQHGHDSHAYNNPNFRQLLIQAIRWVAGEG